MSTRLDIISDVVCPWCYLGAANLLKAIEDRGGAHPFALRWHPFQLDPTIPAEGLDRRAYMTAKFGPDPARLDAAHARLTEMGAEVGIQFRFGAITRSPNTLDAHRLIRWAAADHLQTRTALTLFARYFERGEDVSDHAVLTAAAEEAGLDPAAIARLLAGDADRDGVAAEVRAASEMGVTGVPTFILAGSRAISGAQPPSLWTDLITALEAAAPPA